MSDVAIKVEGLGKQYRITHKRPNDSLKEAIMDGVQSLIGRGKNPNHHANSEESFWALKDVSFEVKKGEVLGVIGRNGAGKSTLLKILSRITEMTEGAVDIFGRVGSLLEVGTGFHPELTGRENVFLNGAILGMKQSEVRRRFDEIVAFAEVEKFLDTPVKHYSSGMYTRLAFAVAAHLETEVVLMDEVLAVGDIRFQKKCVSKMGEVVETGRTIVFVSHNMTAVQRICPRVLWLKDGKLHEGGRSTDTVTRYLNEGGTSEVKSQAATGVSTPWNLIDAPGNNRIRLRRASITYGEGSGKPLTMRDPITLEFEFWNLIPDTLLDINILVVTEADTLAFAAGPDPLSGDNWTARLFPRGLFKSSCFIPGDLLNAGIYRIHVFFGQDNAYVVYRHDDILRFEVQDAVERRWAACHRIDGAVRPLLRWESKQIETHVA